MNGHHDCRHAKGEQASGNHPSAIAIYFGTL
jgi:hypothetical protein